MKRYTYGFLHNLLFLADNPAEDDRPFRHKTTADFSPAFVASVERYIEDFIAHLDRLGFDMDLVRKSAVSFGGDIFLSLSEPDTGFFDDMDKRLHPLQRIVEDWAGSGSLQELSSNLVIDKFGYIDVVYDPADAAFVHGKVFDHEKTRLEVEE